MLKGLEKEANCFEQRNDFQLYPGLRRTGSWGSLPLTLAAALGESLATGQTCVEESEGCLLRFQVVPCGGLAAAATTESAIAQPSPAGPLITAVPKVC